MKHFIIIFLSVVLWQSIEASPLTARDGDFVLHEKSVSHPDWKVSRRLEGHVKILLRIGLKQQNLHSISEHLMSISDPEMFAPSTESTDGVLAWLLDAGFDASRLKMSHNKAWVEVDGATAFEAESLLNTEFHVFEHDSGEEQAGCDTAVVPSCLKTLYNMTYTPKATDRNNFGIVSRYSNTYLQSDLDTFFGNFSPSLVGISPTLVSIDGGTIEIDPASDVGEDGWILQYAMSLAEPQPVQLLQIGNQQTGPIISFNEWLDAVDGSYCTSDGGDDLTFDPQLPNPFPGGLNEHTCGTVKAPNVVSNSQADHEYRFPHFYLQRQCNEFAKLGLMGITVLYAAGNTGVAGAQSGYCLDDNGSMNLNGTHFNPAWPASCPWVTVVGGTQVKPNASTSDSSPEEVWNQDLTEGFFESGGGGFSNHFAQPSYQKSAVEKYLKFMQKSDPANLKNFNVTGRAYPDLSANANLFVNIDDGSVSIDSGTSGATPTVAAIITLVNDARISAGKKPVGFINPMIYSTALAGAFNDIVDGTSQGCKGLQGQRDGGFKATTGWDPATGVGTPNLGKLIEKWLALP